MSRGDGMPPHRGAVLPETELKRNFAQLESGGLLNG